MKYREKRSEDSTFGVFGGEVRNPVNRIVHMERVVVKLGCLGTMNQGGKWKRVLSGIALSVLIAGSLTGWSDMAQAEKGREAVTATEAEIATSTTIGSFDDVGYEQNYMQAVSDGGFTVLQLENDAAASVVRVTYSKLDGQLEPLWTHSITLNKQVSSRTGRGVQRETADGGQLWLADYVNERSERELWAIRTDRQGNARWARPLQTKAMFGSNEDTRISLEPVQDGGFLVSSLDESTNEFTVSKYDQDGNYIWHNVKPCIEQGWLSGNGSSYTMVFNQTDRRGSVAVMADVYSGKEQDRVSLQLDDAMNISGIQEMSNGRIAVTGEMKRGKELVKRTLVFNRRFRLVSMSPEYSPGTVYVPDERTLIRIENQYDRLDNRSGLTMHSIAITGFNARGKSEKTKWKTSTHYREDPHFQVVYNDKLAYKIAEGYALISQTSGSGSPVLDFIKVVLPEG